MTGSETNEQVFTRYAPKFEALRSKLKSIAQKLPPKGSVTADKPAHNLDPAPFFNIRTRSYNTAIVMYEQMNNPDMEIPTPANFNIRLGDADLITHLGWTGPANPMAPSVRANTARSDLATELERSLKLPYVVVIRTLNYQRPVVQGKSFTGGTVDIEGFVVTMKDEKVVASFRTSVKPDPQVMSSFRKGVDDPAQRGESFVYSSMWTNARDNVARTLAEITGGAFVFNR